MTTDTKCVDFAKQIKDLREYGPFAKELARDEVANAFEALLEIVVDKSAAPKPEHERAGGPLFPLADIQKALRQAVVMCQGLGPAPMIAHDALEALHADFGVRVPAVDMSRVVERVALKVASHALQSGRVEANDLRRQKTDLETALASTMAAWHKDKAALESKLDATQRAAANIQAQLDGVFASRDAATKRADLAEATLENVRAAVAKPALDKEDTRPKIGDTVPWSEMEDGLYHRPDYPYPFAMVVGSRVNVVDHDDRAVARMLDGSGRGQLVSSTDPERVVFVARDLGTDPEVWRAAMREHMAKVGK